MADVATDPAGKQPERWRWFLPLFAAVALAGTGFASTFMGFWSPRDLIARQTKGATASQGSQVFVDVPAIELNLPGGRERVMLLAISIETKAVYKQDILHMMPRLRDAFTMFLSGVDPAAYDKRGVLEIIRAELVTRAQLVLGQDAVSDLLITEFRIR